MTARVPSDSLSTVRRFHTGLIARCRVLESTAKTPAVHNIRIEKPNGFDFAPVQFCGLEIETQSGPEEYSMSLACSPTKDYLEFGARVSPSPWKQAFQALRPGDEVEIDGPYGHFILDPKRPAVFLAGGIGVTPLKGMIEYATDRDLSIPLDLVYSNRNEAEIAYRQELDELARRNPRLSIHHTLTREAGLTWTGRRGRIDLALLKEFVAKRPDAAFYICGLPQMVADMVHGLRNLGIGRDQIKYEQFWGYE